MSSTTRALLLLALCAALPACAGVRTLSDPTVTVHTRGGEELGVATDYGLVFLGRTARAGPIQITAWYGDGPNIEKSIIEPVGPVLCTADTPLRLPDVRLDFRQPRAGDVLWVYGRDALGGWKAEVKVADDPRVLGLVTDVPARLAGADDQVGAGVYSYPVAGDERSKRLVGLVAGRIRLRTTAGEREYLAIVGPEELWRIVTHRKDAGARRRPVYREDIL